MKINEIFMHRAIELAECASGLTYPNPMVGAVIVHDNIIIGEGYHRKAGTPHAEVNAVNSVVDKSLLHDSTLYVSLEPCAHYGRTPPCAKLIIDMGIPRVVVGCIDSFSKVSGKGIDMLRKAGVEVHVGVLEKECRKLNRRFFTFHEKKRPYIILKWAESKDGFIDKLRSPEEQAPWLTNEECRRLVHKQRTTEQAILIGANTASMDNPSLTVRSWTGNQPLRIVFDPKLSVPSKLKLFNDNITTVILNSSNDTTSGNIIYKQIASSDIKDVVKSLYELEIQSIIIEGGAQTLQTFIDGNMWDEAYIYKSPLLLGSGIIAPKIILHDAISTTIGNCTLTKAINN